MKTQAYWEHSRGVRVKILNFALSVLSIALAATTTATIPALAQTTSTASPATGIVNGTILDQTGAVCVGAHISLTQPGRSDAKASVSGSNGQFSFDRILPGPFQLKVTAAGFGDQTYSGDLEPGQTFLVPPILMSVATAETTVQVGVTPVEVAEIQIKEQEQQRVLSIIPNFYVTYNPDAAPLNARQKFQLSWKTAIDPVTFAGVGVLSGIQQAADDPSEFGQGAEGFGKRFGAAYASTVAGIFIGNAILPSVFHQDPRYFYKGTGTTRERTMYALGSPFFCKGDNKRWQPNYSYVIGSFASAAISTAYYPTEDRSAGSLVLQNGALRLAEGSLGGILQEFVLKKLTSGRHKNPQP